MQDTHHQQEWCASHIAMVVVVVDVAVGGGSGGKSKEDKPGFSTTRNRVRRILN